MYVDKGINLSCGMDGSSHAGWQPAVVKVVRKLVRVTDTGGTMQQELTLDLLARTSTLVYSETDSTNLKSAEVHGLQVPLRSSVPLGSSKPV